jgi:glucokinase
VTAGKARLTNRDWEISEKALQEFGFREALLINDFAALAFAIDLLTENDLHRIGPQLAGLPGAPITILGPGTGFGVSCLARFGDHIIPLATEGGHVAFAPGNEREMGILRCLWKKYGRVESRQGQCGSAPRKTRMAMFSNVAGYWRLEIVSALTTPGAVSARNGYGSQYE